MPGFFEFHEQVNRRRKPADRAARAAQEPAARPDDRQILTVSQLTARIEQVLKAGFPSSLLVKGEVSNYKHHAQSGHAYFTLKDRDACIDGVMFRSDAARLKFAPEDGMELLASGRIAVYPARGRYQLYVTRLEPLGQGALELAFRQLCARLEAQGLFAAERKKPIPPYPRHIALITSTQTAALQDMLKVLRRYPWVRISVCHVPVQGDGAGERIAAAIGDVGRCAAAMGIELILLGRGGGSLEDLWAFNEEVVARAIVASSLPIITGIGHEVDVAIADLAADHHAHTPTEAAQVAMARWRTAADTLDACGIRLRRELRTMLAEARQRLAAIERHEAFRRPLDRINALRQLLDDRQRAMQLGMSNRLRRQGSRLADLTQRLEQFRPAAVFLRLRSRLADGQQSLTRAMLLRLHAMDQRVAAALARLRERHPRHALRLAAERLSALELRLEGAIAQRLASQSQRVEALAAHLNAISPEQVLRRGYTITTLKKTGAVVRSAEQVRPGDRLLTRFADGQTESVVEDARQLRLFE